MDYNGLPLYRAVFKDDEEGMYCISLVDEGAIGKDFQFYSSEKEILAYSVVNEEKRIVTGPVMIADLPIYRIAPSGARFYIVHDKETIRHMAEKYLADGYQELVDTMHSLKMEEGINMVEWYIKDSERGISPKGYEDVTDGSLFATYHILNDEVWEKIKDGTYRGFSMFAVCSVEPVLDDEDKEMVEIEELINTLKDKLK